MNTLRSLNFSSIVIFILLLIFLGFITANSFLAPVVLFFIMLTLGSLLIIFFSNKDEVLLKLKLFIFFFSIYLIYTFIQHYILLSVSPTLKPFIYHDEETLFDFSTLVIPYIFGNQNFSEIFSSYKLGVLELPLHVIISSFIAYLSIAIDGINTIIVQKLLSPFFGGMFMVVLYATLKHQFLDRTFVLKSTLAYGLLSAVFVYSTPMLRDVDIALTYMIAIYLFLQPNSYKNFFLLSLVAYTTIYLRLESGFVLFGIILIYAYLYVRTIESKSLKYIFYIVIIVLFSFISLVVYYRIVGMIANLNEGNINRSIVQASAGSIGVLLNKLPFGISHMAKVLFSQLQPFPFMNSVIIDTRNAISGIFWPFIFIMMLYAVIKKDIRSLFSEKIKYLLIVAITILFLMSSEPMVRRMMSVYPIIYIIGLNVFYITDRNKIKKMLLYYVFSIISLNILYYLIKI
ncbi:MAG: hypothetical protein COA92_08525 [Sulfurovum sp.]|nr:MAG: hypothetical protein COA92_08525 [Sulfurovum sp.]